MMLGSFGKITKEGWLEKQSKFLKSWRKRWFVLTSTHLYSFKQQQVYNNPTEQLVLKYCTTVKSAQDSQNKQNTFRIDSPERIFYLRALNQQEKELWIGAIGKMMIKPTMNNQHGEQIESESSEESITDPE